MSDEVLLFYDLYPESGYWQQFGEEMVSAKIYSSITSVGAGTRGVGKAQN